MIISNANLWYTINSVVCSQNVQEVTQLVCDGLQTELKNISQEILI